MAGLFKAAADNPKNLDTHSSRVKAKRHEHKNAREDYISFSLDLLLASYLERSQNLAMGSGTMTPIREGL